MDPCVEGREVVDAWKERPPAECDCVRCCPGSLPKSMELLMMPTDGTQDVNFHSVWFSVFSLATICFSRREFLASENLKDCSVFQCFFFRGIKISQFVVPFEGVHGSTNTREPQEGVAAACRRM